MGAPVRRDAGGRQAVRIKKPTAAKAKAKGVASVLSVPKKKTPPKVNKAIKAVNKAQQKVAKAKKALRKAAKVQKANVKHLDYVNHMNDVVSNVSHSIKAHYKKPIQKIKKCIQKNTGFTPKPKPIIQRVVVTITIITVVTRFVETSSAITAVLI